jgi:chromatin assembly factor 1 subunit B
VYSCDFQPLPAAQLKRLLPTNEDDESKDKAQNLIAGGRQYRLATAGGDSKVRVSSLEHQSHLQRDHTDIE